MCRDAEKKCKIPTANIIYNYSGVAEKFTSAYGVSKADLGDIVNDLIGDDANTHNTIENVYLPYGARKTYNCKDDYRPKYKTKIMTGQTQLSVKCGIGGNPGPRSVTLLWQ